MVANTKEKMTTFLSNVEDYIGKIEQKSPAWLNELRRREWQRFVKIGVPSVKDEEWKYTNITPIIEQAYALPEQAGAKASIGALDGYINDGDRNFVFVNGEFVPSLSSKSTPSGITILPLTEAWQKKEADLCQLLDRQPDVLDTSFSSLNRAFTHQGIFIDIAKKTVSEKLIHIIHFTDSQARRSILTPRTLIRLGEASEATILETHISFGQEIYLSSALTEIHMAANAVLHYCKAQAESQAAFHIGTTKVWQEAGSQLDGFSLMTGALITRNNLDIALNGQGCGASLNGLYSPSGQQHVDNHTSVDHRQPNCTSNQLYKGILNGDSRAVFNGKIFVRPIAQLTNSYQLNKNLLLGQNCRVDTKPQLEIYADDVKCTHGATIGQLNEDEIFYLQSRSIARKQAVSMLSHGFVDDIINTVKHDSVRAKLNILIEPTFAAID